MCDLLLDILLLSSSLDIDVHPTSWILDRCIFAVKHRKQKTTRLHLSSSLSCLLLLFLLAVINIGGHAYAGNLLVFDAKRGLQDVRQLERIKNG